MLTDLANIADSLSHGWAYWAFKDFHDITTSSQKESFYDTDGSLEEAKVGNLRSIGLRLSIKHCRSIECKR